MLKNKAKSLFKTKTFQGALLGYIAGLAPLIIPCFYQRRIPNQEEAVAIVGLTITLAWALIGRMQTSPAYTPNNFPGANKSDFER